MRKRLMFQRDRCSWVPVMPSGIRDDNGEVVRMTGRCAIYPHRDERSPGSERLPLAAARGACRAADGDGLRPCRRRRERRGGGAHFRGQGPAALQSADLPCHRHRDGAALRRARRSRRSGWRKNSGRGRCRSSCRSPPDAPVHPLATAGLPTIALRAPRGPARDGDRGVRRRARRAVGQPLRPAQPDARRACHRAARRRRRAGARCGAMRGRT